MGKGKVEMKYGNQIVAFRLPTFRIRQNGRRSVTLRIQRGNAIVGEPDALEVTFPRPRLTDETPKVSYRIDVFASPAQGDMFLANSGESFARLTGTVSLSHFGTEPGDPIEGRLESELFRFLPKEKKNKRILRFTEWQIFVIIAAKVGKNARFCLSKYCRLLVPLWIRRLSGLF